jgi:hypothetical protein
MLLQVLSPLMHANTRAKVIVCGSTYMDKLTELIDEANIPSEIGGQDASGGLNSTEETALREHVLSILRDNSIAQDPVV